MKIGIVKATEGVIIAEFIASNKGLGFMIMQASAFMDLGFIFSGSTGMSSNWRNAFDSALHPLVRRCRLIK